jgi:predicted RNA binding protein YcfA (HicA-like mRNA interferase family)
MKGSEFLRKVQKTAKKNGWPCSWHPNLGKGSHGTLIVNGRRTVVRNLKDELKKGTYFGMLKQLGMTEADLD